MKAKRRRRKQLGRLSTSAQSNLREATVHLEEAEHHARTGNCREALKRFEEGVQALGAGMEAQGGGDDHGLGEMKRAARSRIKTYCLR